MKTLQQIAAEAARKYETWMVDTKHHGCLHIDNLQAIILAAIEKAHGSLLARLDMAERARDCAYKESERYAELMRNLKAANRIIEALNTQLRAAQASSVTQKVIDLAYRVICEQSDECKLENLPNEMQCIADDAAQASASKCVDIADPQYGMIITQTGTSDSSGQGQPL